MRLLLTSIIIFQLSFTPIVASAWPTANANGTGDEETVATLEDLERLAMSTSQATTVTEIDGQPVLPVMMNTLSFSDPYTGEPARLEIYHGRADTPEAADAAVAFLETQLASEARKNSTTFMGVLEGEEDTPAETIDIDPAQFSVKPQNVSRFRIALKGLRNIPQAVANLVPEAIKSRYNKFVDTLTMKSVRNPFNVLRLSKKREVSLETLSFSFSRLVMVGSVVAYGFYSAKDLGLTLPAIATVSMMFATMSSGLQWNKEAYSAFFARVLPIELVRLFAKIARKTHLLSNVIYSNFDDMLKKAEDAVRNSTGWSLVNGAVNFKVTEHAFLIPSLVVFGLFSLSLYPLLYNFSGAQSLTDATLYVVGVGGNLSAAALGVAKGLTITATQALATQGLFDNGTSIITEASKADIAGRLARGEITPEAADIEIRRTRFTLGFRMAAVAMASNLGVIMSFPDSEVANATGDVIVRAMTASGLVYLLTAAYRHKPSFQKSVNDLGAVARDSVLSVRDDFRSLRQDFSCRKAVATSKVN